MLEVVAILGEYRTIFLNCEQELSVIGGPFSPLLGNVCSVETRSPQRESDLIAKILVAEKFRLFQDRQGRSSRPLTSKNPCPTTSGFPRQSPPDDRSNTLGPHAPVLL